MQQVAALPFRRSRGIVEVLLVTSSSGRWIIPKGDIDSGMQPHLAAEKEAFEEGGVRGRIGDRQLGTFPTRKEQDGAAIPVEVTVFPLEVQEELQSWPENDWRRRRWLPLGAAAEAVDEPGLATIIRGFQR